MQFIPGDLSIVKQPISEEPSVGDVEKGLHYPKDIAKQPK